MTQEEKQLLLKDLCARLPYEKLLNTCLDRIDNEVAPDDGSCNSSDRELLTTIINDLILSVYERIV